MNSIILRAATRLLVALLLLFSVYMLLRGHNEPGGGFIGGLIGATASCSTPSPAHRRAARKALRVAPQNIAMVGLGHRAARRALRRVLRRRVLHRAVAVHGRDRDRQGPADRPSWSSTSVSIWSSSGRS
jgi:hypothetical protein